MKPQTKHPRDKGDGKTIGGEKTYTTTCRNTANPTWFNCVYLCKIMVDVSKRKVI